jgi:hypothetical protein
MVLKVIGGQADVGTYEGTGQFGDKFFEGIASIAKPASATQAMP